MAEFGAARFPLNIFLLREGGKTDVGEDLPFQLDLDISGEYAAVLRYGSTSGKPSWLVALSQFSSEPANKIPDVGSVSGILRADVNQRTFVITFGHAWQKLRAQPIEANFGIKCVLNLADSNSLRAIRRDRVAEETIQAIEQIPDQDGIERFGLDVEKDLLRGVKAKVSEDAGFGAWVAGGDSFKASIDLNNESIASFLGRVLKLWLQDSYKQKFDWIDNINPVRNENLVGELNEVLVATLLGSTDGFSLSAPELLTWDDFDYFSYEAKKKNQAPTASHLDIDHWLAYAKDKYDVVDLSVVSEAKIYAFSADGVRSDKWPALSCINGMIVHVGQTYLIHAGNWYSLSNSFVEKVNERVSKIPAASVVLPEVGLKEKEGAYNERVSKQHSGLLLMDKKLVMHGGGKSKLEVCDLLSEDAHLVCVKPWGGASESLSHLFWQARHSVTLINNDDVYRLSVRKYIDNLNKSFTLTWDYLCENPKDAEVVLAILRGCEKEDLPFFAKLSLLDCFDELGRMRFKCSYTAIQIA